MIYLYYVVFIYRLEIYFILLNLFKFNKIKKDYVFVCIYEKDKLSVLR